MEEMFDIVCDEASAGIRLDVFLSEQAELTRSLAQKLIENGDVTVNEKAASKNYKLRLGDAVSLVLPEPESLEAAPEDIPIEILYEDNALIVVNKPQGMVVHPAAGHDSGTLVNALLYHAKGRLSAINGVVRPGIVHRIDKDTSGVLVVAKTNEAHLSLAEQIKEHSVAREYYCLACGKFSEEQFTVDKPIGRHPKDRKKWPLRKKAAATLLRILLFCANIRAAHSFAAGSKQAARTKFVCTLQAWENQLWATLFMALKMKSWQKNMP